MRNWIYAVQSVSAVTLSLMISPAAEAQALQNWTDRGFVNVSGGAQPASRTTRSSGSFALYDETATYDVALPTKGGAMFDLMGGARVWRNLGVALGYSRYSDSFDTVVGARIPDPLAFDAPHDASFGLSDFKHNERAVHLSAVYMLPVVLPVVDLVEVLVYAGPSFFSLDKDVVGGIDVTPGSTSIVGVDIRRVSTSATGAHVGVDARYRITRDIGAGIFLRSASASTDVSLVDGGKVDVGGFSYGVGVRVRF